MRLFISWSGPWSKRLALALRDWLPLTIQAVEPYMSAEDIDKGSRWSSETSQELEICNFGIICLTSGNVNAPWVLFEAGALSKSVDSSRVSPLLLGLKPAQVVGPLVQFQATEINKPDVRRLLHSVNAACGDAQLDQRRLDRLFDAMWPQLEQEVKSITIEMESAQEPSVVRDPQDLLLELLELVRAQSRALATLNQPLALTDRDPSARLPEEFASSRRLAYEAQVLAVLETNFTGESGLRIGRASQIDYLLRTASGALIVEIRVDLDAALLPRLLAVMDRFRRDSVERVDGLLVITRGSRLGPADLARAQKQYEMKVHVIVWAPESGDDVLKDHILALGALP